MSNNDHVGYEFDPHHPPALTAAERAEIEALAALPDDDIDRSDIPPLTETFFAGAVRNPFYRPIKMQLTTRVDADVLAWLKAGGRGYQTKLNAILRQAMLREAAKD
ncbi:MULTISPECIES: BrnA antitoxin family protein [unclassified Methylobacterium]|uniref:BrnA antitoxin family protein n=1 Tax=unclassified Methylobacterium TaxID=2615210 RepID=UPI0006FA1811|nr:MULTISPECIES: BrnA antitoxin family protein [unclassified Methylobacterium]KQO60518.1 cytoplasmic protein [Methylobacterium sp. Leaf86]KQP00260.1 cytoplasmic protein [Methylobacterium sp. Leaf91]